MHVMSADSFSGACMQRNPAPELLSEADGWGYRCFLVGSHVWSDSAAIRVGVAWSIGSRSHGRESSRQDWPVSGRSPNRFPVYLYSQPLSRPSPSPTRAGAALEAGANLWPPRPTFDLIPSPPTTITRSNAAPSQLPAIDSYYPNWHLAFSDLRCR